MREILHQYVQFNKWANELLLTLIEKEISDELLDKNLVSSFPSLRKTVYHVWDAEWIWLRRLKGESLDNWPSKNFSGNFSEAKNKLLENNESFITYVISLNENSLIENFSYKNIEGKNFTNARWQSIQHCINHSTYHRGQIVTMLRQLGVMQIPSTDYISFVRHFDSAQ